MADDRRKGRGTFGDGCYRLVRRLDKAYLYSRLTDRIYPLNPGMAEALESSEPGSERLRNLELASGAELRPTPAPPDPLWIREHVGRALDHEVQQVVLGITERCNLRCHYCIYSGKYQGPRTHSESYMSWEVARKAIDYLLSHSADASPGPAIAFYGGEPFLDLALIRRCAEYAKLRSNGRMRYVVTTNGTLLGKHARELAIEHNFTLLVSLDGPAEIHNRNRRDTGGRPTFERITANLEDLRREAPDYFARQVCFSVVLAPPVDYASLTAFFDGAGIACMVSAVENYGNSELLQHAVPPDLEPVSCAFEDAGRKWKSGKEPDPTRRFAVGLLGASLHRIQTRRQRSDMGYYRLGQCIPGVRKIFVNSRGEIYPCEKVEGAADVRIGHVDTGVDAEAVIRLLMRFMETVAGRCSGCWMRGMCTACLADAVHGGSFEPKKMDVRCAGRQFAQSQVLALYASLLESDPQLLDFLSAAFPWE